MIIKSLFTLRLIVLPIILLLGACQIDPTPASEAQPVTLPGQKRTPAQTVNRLTRAFLDKEFETYYALVSSHDRGMKSLDELKAEFENSGTRLVTDFLFRYTSFNVDSTQIEGDSARVYVTSVSPNMDFVLHHAGVIERDVGDAFPLDNKLGLLLQRYNGSGSPRDTLQAVYRLVHEPGNWYVVIGWNQ